MSHTATSESEATDTDWSQIRETVVMLYLSAAQIESAMHEGGQSVERLTHSFETIRTSSKQIGNAIQAGTKPALPAAEAALQTINGEIQNSVVAFQFHDRITQRLNNVPSALHSLSDLVGDHERMSDPAQWRQLQDKIKESYTTESERLMFEHIMLGASVTEALDIYRHHFNDLPSADENEDDIELF